MTPPKCAALVHSRALSALATREHTTLRPVRNVCREKAKIIRDICTMKGERNRKSITHHVLLGSSTKVTTLDNDDVLVSLSSFLGARPALLHTSAGAA